jgi:hypothetical protein
VENEQALQEELKELGSRLAGLPRLHPFRLPAAGYLSTLPTALTDGAVIGIAAEPQPDWSKASPFETPAGYFENLAASLTHGVNLANGRSAPSFEIPAGYFDRLPQDLLAGLKTAEAQTLATEKKTIAFRPVWRKALPWIAAAAILSGVWIGVRPGNRGSSADKRAMNALAVLDRDSIDNYVELHADDFDPETLESALAGGQITDFRKAVSDLRNDEIEDYLNDAGSEAQPSKGT